MINNTNISNVALSDEIDEYLLENATLKHAISIMINELKGEQAYNLKLKLIQDIPVILSGGINSDKRRIKVQSTIDAILAQVK